MRTRRIRTQIVWAAIVAMLVAFFGIANSEESSILQGATSTNDNENFSNAVVPLPILANAIVAGNYKLVSYTDETDLNSGKKEFGVDMANAE